MGFKDNKKFHFSLLVNTLAVVLTLLIINQAYARPKVKGTIRDKDGNPASGIRVELWDYDFWPEPLGNEYMNAADTTDSNGYYEMEYDGTKGRWDLYLGDWRTAWRPDIYIRIMVYVPGGYCEGGAYDPDEELLYLDASPVHTDHKQRNDLTINFTSDKLPYSNDQIRAYFNRIGEDINMHCEFDFFFHYNCFSCYSGKKISWSDWSGLYLPDVARRCFSLTGQPECTSDDYEKSGRGFTRPIDPPGNSGSGLSTSENTDTDGDGVLDNTDNCPTVANANQVDSDEDGKGNACDLCPEIPGPHADQDSDGIGDACDQDRDGDGCINPLAGVESSQNQVFDQNPDDNYVIVANEHRPHCNPSTVPIYWSESADFDGDGIPNCYDQDDDNDGILDENDDDDVCKNEADKRCDRIGKACSNLLDVERNACIGGGCVQELLRVKLVVNPMVRIQSIPAPSIVDPRVIRLKTTPRTK